MGVTFRVLGPVEVSDAGERLAVPSGRLLTLLSGLLLRANQVVPIDRLARWLWEGTNPEPARARATIQEYVRRLRRAVGSEDVICTAHGGYLIMADEDSLDLFRFRAVARRGRTAAEAGDPRAAAEDLTAALDLWRGPALANVDSSTLYEDEVANLTEQHLRIRELWVEVQLRLRQHQAVIADLRDLTREHPLREKPWEQLMIALYRDGRQAEALAAYDEVRALLAEDLGVDPGPSLLAARQAILVSDPSLMEEPPVPGPPTRPAAAPRLLPPDVRGFTGRAADLAALDALVDAHDNPEAILITAIAGTAGVGKTALAVHWARRVADSFPDGQLWINLHGYDPDQPVTPEQALTIFLRSLGVPGPEIPLDLDAQTALFRSLVEGRRMLVVLDNASSPEQVRPLLPGTPGCLVVITSRDELRGLVARDGAARIRLDLLDEHDSIALVRRLIGQEADPGAVAELVERCCRLPLAIRIAAELVTASRTVRDVVNLLAADSTLDNLGAGGDPRTAIRTVFSWSYRALDPAAARLFRLLGLLRGDDWDSYTAAALADCSHAEARRLLDLVTSAHLVEHDHRRFHMHDLLRAYATEHADDSTERQAASTRLFDYYLHTAATAMDRAFPHERHRRPAVPEASTPVPVFSDASQALEWLDAERLNLRVAATLAMDERQPTFAIHLSATIARYLFAGAYHSDALFIHGVALQAAQATGDQVALAWALHNLGTTHLAVDKFDGAADHFRRALTLFQNAGNRLGEARATTGLGLICHQSCDYDQAYELHQRTIAMYREAGDRAGEAFALDSLSDVHFRWGRYAESLDHITQALDIYREIGDRIGEASALDMLGRIAMRRGQLTDALVQYGKALTIYQEIGDRIGEAVALADLGQVTQKLGRYAESRDHGHRALAIVREAGDRLGEAHTLTNLADLYRQWERYAEAVDYCLEALVIARELDTAASEFRTLNVLGKIKRAMGRLDESLAHHQFALTHARRIDYTVEQAVALDGMADTYHDLGDLSHARQHWREALDLYTSLDAPEVAEIRTKLSELPAHAYPSSTVDT